MSDLLMLPWVYNVTQSAYLNSVSAVIETTFTNTSGSLSQLMFFVTDRIGSPIMRASLWQSDQYGEPQTLLWESADSTVPSQNDITIAVSPEIVLNEATRYVLRVRNTSANPATDYFRCPLSVYSQWSPAMVATRSGVPPQVYTGRTGLRIVVRLDGNDVPLHPYAYYVLNDSGGFNLYNQSGVRKACHAQEFVFPMAVELTAVMTKMQRVGSPTSGNIVPFVERDGVATYGAPSFARLDWDGRFVPPVDIPANVPVRIGVTPELATQWDSSNCWRCPKIDGRGVLDGFLPKPTDGVRTSTDPNGFVWSTMGFNLLGLALVGKIKQTDQPIRPLNLSGGFNL
jgi:hypothetical protein